MNRLASGLLGAALAALSSALPAAAEESGIAEDAREASKQFAECAGFWDVMSNVEQASGNRASAEYMHNLANGATTAALYWYAVSAQVDGDERERPYGHWDPMVRPHRESAALRIWSFNEKGMLDEITSHGELCRDILPMQENALHEIRKQFVEAQP